MSNSEVWKVLALSLAESAECVLANADLDNMALYGAGDLKHMLQTIKAQRKQDRKNPISSDEKTLMEITKILDESGMAIGNEHESYSIVQRVENLALAKDYFVRQTDKARAQARAQA